MSGTFSGNSAHAHKNTSAAKNVKGVEPSRKLAQRRKLTADMVDAMYRIPNHLVVKENLSVAPLFLQRRWARITCQYMSKYMKGAAACDAIDACSKAAAMQQTS